MNDDPREWTQEEVDAHFEEALLVVEGSNPELAIPMFEDLLVSGAVDAPSDDETMVSLRMYLGRAHMRAGQTGRALPILRAALSDAVRVTGGRSRLTFSCMGNLCRALGDSGEFEEALSVARQLHDARLEEFGETDNGTLNALGHLAQLSYEAGHVEAACELTQKQLDLRTQAFGEHDSRTETSRFNLTVMRARLHGDGAPVEDLLRRYERDFGSVSPQVIALRTSLAGIHEMNGRLAEAVGEWTRVETDQAELLGADAVPVLVATVRRLRVQQMMGDPQAGAGLVEVGRRISRIAGPDHPALAYCGIDRNED